MNGFQTQSGTLSDQHYILQSKEIIVFEMVTTNKSEIEYESIMNTKFLNIYGVTIIVSGFGGNRVEIHMV